MQDIVNYTSGTVALVTLLLTYLWGKQEGKREIHHVAQYHIEARVSENKGKWLVEGEKVGFEKGFEAGKTNAQRELKDLFIKFLEEQVRVLKTDEAAVPNPTKPPENKDEPIYIYD